MSSTFSTTVGRQQRSEPRERSPGVVVVVRGVGVAGTASLANRSRSGCLLRVNGRHECCQGQTIEVCPTLEAGPTLLMRVVRVAARDESTTLLGCRRVRSTTAGQCAPSMRVHVRASQAARRATR
jgi:hypothetical protein